MEKSVKMLIQRLNLKFETTHDSGIVLIVDAIDEIDDEIDRKADVLMAGTSFHNLLGAAIVDLFYLQGHHIYIMFLSILANLAY